MEYEKHNSENRLEKGDTEPGELDSLLIVINHLLRLLLLLRAEHEGDWNINRYLFHWLAWS